MSDLGALVYSGTSPASGTSATVPVAGFSSMRVLISGYTWAAGSIVISWTDGTVDLGIADSYSIPADSGSSIYDICLPVRGPFAMIQPTGLIAAAGAHMAVYGQTLPMPHRVASLHSSNGQSGPGLIVNSNEAPGAGNGALHTLPLWSGSARFTCLAFFAAAATTTAYLQILDATSSGYLAMLPLTNELITGNPVASGVVDLQLPRRPVTYQYLHNDQAVVGSNCDVLVEFYGSEDM